MIDKIWIFETEDSEPYTVPSDCNLMPVFLNADDAVNFYDRLPEELKDRLCIRVVRL